MTSSSASNPSALVVVPAHNEQAVLGRLLDALGPWTTDDELEVVVVANGCTDRTAEIARSYRGVRVIELAEGNKQAAMRAGAARAGEGPIVFVDADVVVSRRDVQKLVEAVSAPHILAAAPRRVLDLEGASPVVRSYYRVWTSLPVVVSGLFGRGVIALAPEGYLRVADLPMFIADDLALSESFRPDERRLVGDSEVRVVGPRRLADLVRRRRRISLGVREFESHTPRRERTTLVTLWALVRRDPLRLPDIAVFLGVTVVTRLAVARDSETSRGEWLRDESSRGP